MQKSHKIDLTKLLGFAAVSEEVSGRVDFKNAAVDAKLGAKVGAEAWADMASECPADAPKPVGQRGLQPR
jgi:hypothetical protein